MKKIYTIKGIEHTFEFGKHVNGTDVILESHSVGNRVHKNWTTVFDVLPQTEREAEHMLSSSEWNENKGEAVN